MGKLPRETPALGWKALLVLGSRRRLWISFRGWVWLAYLAALCAGAVAIVEWL